MSWLEWSVVVYFVCGLAFLVLFFMGAGGEMIKVLALSAIVVLSLGAEKAWTNAIRDTAPAEAARWE